MTLIARKGTDVIYRIPQGKEEDLYNSPVLLEGGIEGELFHYWFPNGASHVDSFSANATQTQLLQKMQAPCNIVLRFRQYFPKVWSVASIKTDFRIRVYFQLSFVDNQGFPFLPKEGFNPYMHESGKLIPHEWVSLPEEKWQEIDHSVNEKQMAFIKYHVENFQKYEIELGRSTGYYPEWVATWVGMVS